MTDDALIDRLNQTIDALLARADATAALTDAQLAPLARVAADLRYYPDPDFKARLRAQLRRRTAMSPAIVTTQIREGFTTLTPYVMVRGTGLVDFLGRVFGAEETFSARGSAGGMHREVRVGSSMLMIGEVAEGTAPIGPAALHVYVDDVDAAYERALAAGGTSLGAPADRPYGERAGFIRDPFGNNWYVATSLHGSAVPEGQRTVTPFVHAPAAATYVAFLERAFGAVAERRHDEGGQVRYARLRIGNAAIELGEAARDAEPMRSSFYLYVDDPDRLYEQAVAAGATSLWPPAEQPYGDRMGAVEDSLGNQWFIARSAVEPNSSRDQS